MREGDTVEVFKSVITGSYVAAVFQEELFSRGKGIVGLVEMWTIVLMTDGKYFFSRDLDSNKLTFKISRLVLFEKRNLKLERETILDSKIHFDNH